MDNTRDSKSSRTKISTNINTMTKIMLKKQRIVKQKLNKNKKKYMKSFFQDAQEDLENCTTHGLPYILNARLHFVERIFWLISFIGSLSFMIVLLSAQYTRFIKYPTVISVEMNYFDWNISYPALTLCPLQKIEPVAYRHLIKKTFYATGLNTESFIWAITSGCLENLNYMSFDIHPNVSRLIAPKNYAKVAAETFIKFPDQCLHINPNRSFSLEPVMTEMGMCHAINSNVAIYDNPLKHKTDQEYPRKNIELNIYDGEFIAQLFEYTHYYKVYIHHPDESCLSTSTSVHFDVQGILTWGLSVWSTRVSDELRWHSISMRKCRFVNEPLTKRYPIYSYNHCILECRIGVIFQLCGCIPHFYKKLPSERVCSINELKCVMKYKKEISSLEIPQSLLKRFPYSKKLPKSPKDCGCLSNCEIDLYRKEKDHYVFEQYVRKLEIGISSFPKMRIVRDIIFHTNDILLRSGGVVNLFIGVSIISIFEILVIMAKMFVYFVYKCYRRIRSNS